MSFPEAFSKGLHSLSRVFRRYHECTGFWPVLVGGAAAALHSGGGIQSADFDVVAANDEVWSALMKAEGWKPEDRANHLRGGWYHPDIPGIAVERVSGHLFDGRVDPRGPKATIRLDTVGGTIVIPRVEDMIADRLGQACSGAIVDVEMVEQAQLLYDLADDIDLDYLSKRIGEEQGDVTLLDLAARNDRDEADL